MAVPEIPRQAKSRQKRWSWWIAGVFVAVVLAFATWVFWAESNPDAERALRTAMRHQMAEWFPEGMTIPEGEFGWLVRHEPTDSSVAKLAVILIHGLDEPGDIWDDAVPVFAAPDRWIVEFRYPNDQPVAESADLLAREWERLPVAADASVVVIGHSMGGLVTRDFITRYVAQNSVEGPPIAGVALVATPNHGSEWARFRLWLEWRDQLGKDFDRDYLLFAGLRDGAGEAKVDLRPGSSFLRELNARSWPPDIPLRLIGGLILPERAAERTNLDGILPPAVADAWARWWANAQTDLGDGVVTIESLTLPDAPRPLIFPASHRGLLHHTPIDSGPPPALPILADWIAEWEKRQ